MVLLVSECLLPHRLHPGLQWLPCAHTMPCNPHPCCIQTLYFAAMLRLPRTWAHADKLKRVEMVLQGLGLDKCRDTIIVSAA